jgi:predicted transcriptional regulator of viral defense system
LITSLLIPHAESFGMVMMCVRRASASAYWLAAAVALSAHCRTGKQSGQAQVHEISRKASRLWRALARLTAAGLRARGLYALPNAAVSEFETLAMVATRSPQSIFCLLTALQCHELTTQLPREIWIAMPRGSHTPKLEYPPLKMIKFSSEAYAAGIEEIERDGVTLRLYNPAKTVVDCFKHRSKIGLDVALEALREARALNKATPTDIWHFAKICRVSSVIRPYLESVG